MFRERYYTQELRGTGRGRGRNECITHARGKASHPSVTIWFGGDFLPTTEEASVYSLQFKLSAITSCLPALSGNAKPCSARPQSRPLKSNQAERRHGSPLPRNQRQGEIWWRARNCKRRGEWRRRGEKRLRACVARVRGFRLSGVLLRVDRLFFGFHSVVAV